MCFWFRLLMLALKVLPPNIAYAISAGLGIALIVGVVVVVNLFSSTAPH